MEEIIGQLNQQRERLKDPDRLEDTGRITALVDVALISLYNRLTNRLNLDPQHIRRHGSILATGDFGRRQLGPLSPVSLLFLQTPDAPTGEKDWVEGIVAPLRQAGWDVIHCVTTPPEARDLALNDLSWLGAVIDSRFISGSRALMEELHLTVQREIQASRERPALLRFIQEWRERQAGQQDPAYLLEPDLEYSAGSLGELGRVRWAGFLVHGKKRLGQISALDPETLEHLREARQFFLRVRSHLQLLRGGLETRLRYEDQNEVARRLGYEDQGDFLGVELMMRDLERHFYNVRLLADRWRDLFEDWQTAGEEEGEPAATELASGIRVERGRLAVTPTAQAGPPGKSLLELFRQAVRRHMPLGVEAFQWCREQAHHAAEALDDPQFIRDWLFEMLREETPEILTVRALYDTEVLQALIPEFRPVHALVQHDAFHLFPVHEHQLQAFAEMKKLLAGHYDDPHPGVRDWAEGGEDAGILLLSALIHDIGKSGGHGHAQRGGQMALAIGPRLGLSEGEAELLSFLVTNHVLLTDSAARRDLADQGMIQHCTKQIGSVKRLKLLMLHSFADLRATGPRAWEYYQGLPICELYEVLLQRLEKGEPDEGAVKARLQLLRQRISEILGGDFTPEELDHHFGQFGARYLLTVSSKSMANHLRLARKLDEVPVSWQVRKNQDTWELTVMSREPLDLLFRVAGILTLHGLDIRQAQTHTRRDGISLQILEVAVLNREKEVSWEQIMTDLNKALHGKIALEYRLALHRTQQKRERSPGPKRPDEVVVDNRSSDRYTIIEVYTSDRPGLLYAITHMLLQLQLQVFLAKISTRMDQVADIFYVRTIDGQRVEDPEQIQEIKQALLYSLH
jgi:[protein-PII] uridylyltransferase